ncbi:LytR/AlgR family response regulator transcription factor [Undibacterium sp. Dicai25W]|uniref:LytR/AlgR family response regulator transcription factor n=1 Tax=Undibacterium sp. Dicai25W TaxID=3413034 RepID=UPI003BF328C1
MNTNATLTEREINRAIIVDDEESGRIMLRYFLSAKKNWTIVGEFFDVATARSFLDTQKVDIIFLDIQMPKENGIEFARSLSNSEQPPLIIFVTAYNTHAIEAFEVHALDYLLKPINPRRFTQTLQRASEMLNDKRGYANALRDYFDREQVPTLTDNNSNCYLKKIVARSVGLMESISVDDIDWIASAGNYVELHLNQRIVLHRIALSILEKHLDPQVFIRVHRSFIVRIDQLKSIAVVGDGSYSIKLICGAQIPVSERYVEKTREFF